MVKFTYTVFDSDPRTSSGDAGPWPDMTRVSIEAPDLDTAVRKIRQTIQSGEIGASGEYDGLTFYARIWKHGALRRTFAIEL